MQGSVRRSARAAAAAWVLVLALASAALAYERDASWGGGDGIVTTDGGAGTGDNFFDMEVLPNGKVLAAGRTSTAAGGQDFLLVKYNADGTLDTSFGGDGIVITNFAGSIQDVAAALDVQSDGKIVLAGETKADTIGAQENFAVARYNSDGSLDTNADADPGTHFDTDGLVTVPVDADDQDRAFDVVVDGSGRVVVVGSVYVPGTDEFDFAVVRLTSAGALDTAFDGDGGSGNGIVTVDFTGANGDDYALGAALLDDADIIVAGGAYDGSGDDSALARLNTADGTLDDSFDNDGRVVNQSGNFIEDLAVSPGKVLGVGADDGNDWSLERYNQADGALDTGFGGGDGMVTTIFPGQSSARAEAVAIDGNRYVVGGDVNLANSNGEAIGVARYQGEGSLDGGFNGDGVMVADLAPPEGTENVGGVGIADDANALTQNPVLVAGDLDPNTEDNASSRDGLLMRLAPDVTAPVSRITKPDHRESYRPGRIRTLSGTAADPNDGSGINANDVGLALRRKKTNGSCAWWDGDSFAAGDCTTKVFFDAAGAEEWDYTLPVALKSSIGTKIKDYTLYSRAIDQGNPDNEETSFSTGRNANRFDVR